MLLADNLSLKLFNCNIIMIKFKYHCALLDTVNADRCNGKQAVKNKLSGCGKCLNKRLEIIHEN